MRYVGQGFEVDGARSTRAARTCRRAAFEAAYVALARPQRPGRADRGDQLARALTRGPDPDLRLDRRRRPATASALKGTRGVLLPERRGYVATPVYDRYRLGPGTQIDGPAIVEERESTTVVGPGRDRPVAEDGSLIIERGRVRLDPRDRRDRRRNRLISILNEQQAALVRTAFTTIVRESEDLACGVFDRARPDARPVAQRHARATSTRWRPA